MAEFGALGRIAPGYQLELAMAATWRLGLLLAAAAVCGMLFGNLAWRGAPWATIKPPTGYMIVAAVLGTAAWGWQVVAALGCLRAARRAPALRPALAGSRPGTCRPSS